MQQTIELFKKYENDVVSLKTAKQYLRIDHNHDDEIIKDMIDIATISAENYIGIKIIKVDWKMTIYDYLPNQINLVHNPIISIKYFKIEKTNGENSYLLDNSFFINKQKLILKNNYLIKKVEILYNCGFTEIPVPIKQGILEHMAKLYDLRGSDHSMPLAAKSLYQAYKLVRI